MEFKRYKSTRTKTAVGTVVYSNSLQLYAVPPTETISLQEFEELAIDRLKGSLSC